MSRRSPLIFIFITAFVDMLGYGMMLPLLPAYVSAQDGGAAIAGSLSSLYATMQLISGPILGALSDRFGRRPVLLTCLTGTALAFLLLGRADTLGLIFIAILLDGLTGGNLTTVYAYIADVTSKEDRAKGLSLVGAAFGLGVIGGPLLGGLLSPFGLGVPAYTASAIAFANVIYGTLFLPESLPKEHRIERTSIRMFNSAAQLFNIFSIRSIRLLLVGIFTLNLAFSGLQTNFPLFSSARFGWDARSNSFFYGFVGVSAVLVQGVIFRWLHSRFGENRLVRMGLVLMAIGLGSVAAAEQAWMLYVFIAMVTLGSGISIPALSGLVSSQVPASSQGRLMGGTQALLSLANIIGPGIAGITFEFIDPSAPYWLGSAISIFTLAVVHVGLTNQA